MKSPLILVGGGDHCSSCIDVIEQENKFQIEGIVDIKEKIGGNVLGYPIIGCDDDLPRLAKTRSHFFITIGHVLSSEPRERVYHILKSLQVSIPTIISPLAYISKHAKIGEGCIIFPFSMVDVNAQIGNNCIVNIATTIAHSAIVGNHCHIAANCVLGKCIVHSRTFIGGNSWINNGVEITSSTVIGCGSNVIRSISENGVYAGNPAKKLSPSV